MEYVMEQVEFFKNSFQHDIDMIFDSRLALVLLLIFFAISVYTDMKSMLLYTKVNITFLILRVILIFIPVYGLEFRWTYIVGAILGALLLIIPAVIKEFNMGGDIKFLFVLGAYVGGFVIPVILAFSCVFFLLVAAFRKVILKENIKKMDMPYCPFFALGFISVIILNTLI